MKAVAHRPRDIGDIEAVLDAVTEVDWDYVFQWAHEFASALDAPEIIDTLESFRARGT